MWLRSKGVRSKTPLHALRKEYGSQINARYGLTAGERDAAPRGRCGDRSALRREQTAIGLGLRASAQERADYHSDRRRSSLFCAMTGVAGSRLNAASSRRSRVPRTFKSAEWRTKWLSEIQAF